MWGIPGVSSLCLISSKREKRQFYSNHTDLSRRERGARDTFTGRGIIVDKQGGKDAEKDRWTRRKRKGAGEREKEKRRRRKGEGERYRLRRI